MAKKKATRKGSQSAIWKKAGSKKPASSATVRKKSDATPTRRKKATGKKTTRKTSKKKIGRPRLTDKQKAEKKARQLKERQERTQKIRGIGEAVAKNAPKRKAAVSRDIKKVGSKGGRKPFIPTEQDRTTVELAVGLGLRHEEICLFVINPATGKPISEDTLEAKFGDELRRGIPTLAMKVGTSMLRRAIGDGPQANAAGIWLSKCRLGWREKSVVEVQVKSGVLVAPAAQTPEEWITQAATRSAGKSEPGSEDDE